MERSEDILDRGEEYMEQRRESIGLDDHVSRSAGLALSEQQALEWFSLYSRDLEDDQKHALRSAIIKLLGTLQGALASDAAELRRATVKTGQNAFSRRMWSLTAAFIVLLAAIFTFSRNYVTVDPNDGGVFVVGADWWGLRTTETEVRWMHVRLRVPWLDGTSIRRYVVHGRTRDSVAKATDMLARAASPDSA